MVKERWGAKDHQGWSERGYRIAASKGIAKGGQSKNISNFLSIGVFLLYVFSVNGDLTKVIHQLAGDVLSLYASSFAFAALKTDGSVVAWGQGRYGGDCDKVQEQLEGVWSIHSTPTAFRAVA